MRLFNNGLHQKRTPQVVQQSTKSCHTVFLLLIWQLAAMDQMWSFSSIPINVLYFSSSSRVLQINWELTSQEKLFIHSQRPTFCHFYIVWNKRADVLLSVHTGWQTHVVAVVPAIYQGPLTVQVSCGSLPRTAKTSVMVAAIFLCGQSVRWRCCLLASWHGTHGYLQQQCSLTGKWSRSPSKLSSISPGSALPDCSDSQSDITKCQPLLPPPFFPKN